MPEKADSDKAWETMRNASPGKKAAYTRKRRQSAKEAAKIGTHRQWEPGKVRHLKGQSKNVAPNTCINCGDNRPYVLHKHHVEPEEETLVTLCANCHDIVRRAGLKELK